jgi:retron-type reverse transcriptase
MVLDDIHCALHKKLHCAMLIDLSKAFDTVDHTVLVQRLKCIGITGHVLQWFVNYMSNRTQFNNKAGVPQGSIVSPLLFIIYINNIGRHIETVDVKL